MNLCRPAFLLALLVASILLFARLGHYALWDDEANTALIAEGICATGDTSAVIGHNLVAYEGGWELKNLRERYIPPLPAYLTAASLVLFGDTSFAARIPFAICGLGFFAVILVWLARKKVDRWTWGLIVFALLTNVSLILYFRQARYYGIVIFLSSLLAYLYLHWTQGRARRWLMLLLAFALLASNYISFGATLCCLSIDWCIWGRQEVRLKLREAAVMFIPFAIAAAALIHIYNPFAVTQPAPAMVAHAELSQLWWNLRDLSINEFCILPLLMLTPIVAIWRRDKWLLRGGVALVVYFAAINIVEPHHSSFAELRFLATLIPLCSVLQVRALLLAAGRQKWIAVLVGVPIIGTNVLSGSMRFHPGLVNIPLRSTICSYIGELLDPPPDPYRAASDWINMNVPTNATICVFPGYAAYPLMFHAPRQVYGWQLLDPAQPQFKSQPDIQIVGRSAPQYILLFGQEGLRQLHPIQLRDGSFVNYRIIKTLPIVGKDLFRPELYLRVFSAPPIDPLRDGVFILRGS